MNLYPYPTNHLMMVIDACVLTRFIRAIDTGIGGTGLSLSIR